MTLEEEMRLYIESLDGEPFFTSTIAEALESDYWEVDRILKKLGKEGFIEPVTDEWKSSLQGGPDNE